MIVPSGPELFVGAFVAVVVVVGLAWLMAWDLKRRQVDAWWGVLLVTLLAPPIGIIAWIILRIWVGREHTPS